MKKFAFVNEAAKKAFMDLPKSIRTQFGVDIYAVQNGDRPYSKFKNIAESIGPGSIELIENSTQAFRAVYCAKYNDTVFVLHAFTKTTNGVDRHAMAVAKQRYKEMLDVIRDGGESL